MLKRAGGLSWPVLATMAPKTAGGVTATKAVIMAARRSQVGAEQHSRSSAHLTEAALMDTM